MNTTALLLALMARTITLAEAEQVNKGLGIDNSRIHVVPNGVEDRFDNFRRLLFGEADLLEDMVHDVRLGDRHVAFLSITASPRVPL